MIPSKEESSEEELRRVSLNGNTGMDIDQDIDQDIATVQKFLNVAFIWCETGMETATVSSSRSSEAFSRQRTVVF